MNNIYQTVNWPVELLNCEVEKLYPFSEKQETNTIYNRYLDYFDFICSDFTIDMIIPFELIIITVDQLRFTRILVRIFSL